MEQGVCLSLGPILGFSLLHTLVRPSAAQACGYGGDEKSGPRASNSHSADGGEVGNEYVP